MCVCVCVCVLYGFARKKERRGYRAENMTETDYAADVVLLANTPDQAESLLRSLEQTAKSNGLYVNANKTEFMSFKLERSNSNLRSKHLKVIKPVEMPRQRYLIYYKLNKHTLRKDASCYWQIFDNLEFGARGDRGSNPGCVIPKTQKWYLIPPCLTLSTIRYVSKAK